jgi:glycosyltransferase involved in cell wall biosynthesis
VINTLHGFYFHNHMAPAARRFYIQMEKIAARCSDVILSQNSEDIRTAIDEKICRPDQIRFLGNGINVIKFDRSKINPATLTHVRRDLGLPDDIQVIGFVGRLVAEKGILDLMQAARIVAASCRNVRFLIIGPYDNEKVDALSPKIADDYGVTDLCIFPGMRQDMPELYALMDIFVLPSYREGFPRSPMEASAMGVPCVLTDIRGCREAVIHGRNGLLVPLRDADALAAALLDLLTDRSKAQQFGSEGRRMALEQFDERLVFQRVKAEYSRLLQEKGLSIDEPHAARKLFS